MAELLTSNVTGNLTVGSLPNTSKWSGGYVEWATKSANNYGGLAIQNQGTGANASIDFVAITDDGNDTVFYVDVGINGSLANDAVYPYLKPRDAYLICSGNTANACNLTIATLSVNSSITFGVGGNSNSNIAITISPVPGGGGNVNVTGNVNITNVLFTANATVNSVSFIPAWTSATINASYTTISGTNPPSFWIDPFKIVHIRGTMKPASNLGVNSILNVNVANGFPAPANSSVFGLLAANAVVNGTNTTILLQGTLNTNGALQFKSNSAPATGNLAYVSLDAMLYSLVG